MLEKHFKIKSNLYSYNYPDFTSMLYNGNNNILHENERWKK